MYPQRRRVLCFALALGLVFAATEVRADDEPGVELRVSPRLDETVDRQALARRLAARVRPDRSQIVATLLALLPTAALSAAGILMLRDSDSALAGVGLLSLGIAVGPSLGHFYAGEFGLGGILILGRSLFLAAGKGALALAGLVALSSTFSAEPDDGDEAFLTTMVVLAVGCGVVAVGGAIYGIIDASGAVRRRLARRRAEALRRGLASLSVAPMIGPTARGGTVLGLMAAMRF